LEDTKNDDIAETTLKDIIKTYQNRAAWHCFS